MKRRSFIKSSLALTSVSALQSCALTRLGKRPKVLVLGGRGYFGPTLVNTLLSQECEVTLFNRGITNPHLFPQLTWIKGDRESSDDSGLALLKQHLQQHRYDWCIDTWQKSPLAVKESVKLIKPFIGKYHYVSSIVVYADFRASSLDESSEIRDTSEWDENSTKLNYIQRKTISEKFLFDHLGDMAGTFRSHGMRSDRTPEPIYEPYWPVRFYEGGEILLPQDDKHIYQINDVQAMCDFMYKMGVSSFSGAVNVARQTDTFNNYVAQASATFTASHSKVWVPKEFLAQHDILPYKQLPLWRPGIPAFYNIKVEKAEGLGLQHRPLGALLTEQVSGYLKRYPKNDFVFGKHGTISREKEKSVLTAWHQRSSLSSISDKTAF